MSTNIRQERMARMLFEELSIIVGSELEDPRLSLARVTDVKVSRDLRNVKVFVFHDDDEVSQRDVLDALRQAQPYVRREIATRCTMPRRAGTALLVRRIAPTRRAASANCLPRSPRSVPKKMKRSPMPRMAAWLTLTTLAMPALETER